MLRLGLRFCALNTRTKRAQNALIARACAHFCADRRGCALRKSVSLHAGRISFLSANSANLEDGVQCDMNSQILNTRAGASRRNARGVLCMLAKKSQS